MLFRTGHIGPATSDWPFRIGCFGSIQAAHLACVLRALIAFTTMPPRMIALPEPVNPSRGSQLSRMVHVPRPIATPESAWLQQAWLQQAHTHGWLCTGTATSCHQRGFQVARL